MSPETGWARALLIGGAALAIAASLRPVSVLSHERVSTTVTYDREIVRIVTRKCIACHSDANLGVPLTTYEQTRPWARAIEEEVLRRTMPPWRAAPGYGRFRNDLALTNRELQLLIAWVEGNGPKTKAQQLIVNLDQQHTPASERLVPDFERWQLGKPDLLATLPESRVLPGQGDEVRRVVTDLGLTSDRWVRAMEFKPGDRRIVRAVFFSVQETGQWLGSWTPWYAVTTLPDRTAYRIPAGSHVVAEIHYRGAREAGVDRGRLGLYFSTARPAHEPADLMVVSTREAAAPGGSRPARIKFFGSLELPTDVTVLALKPESRAGIESVEVSARRPDGGVEPMLLVRQPLPAWPTPYVLAEGLRLPRDTKVQVTYYFTGASPPDELLLTAGISRDGMRATTR